MNGHSNRLMLSVMLVGLLTSVGNSYAEDGAITIFRDVPAHVPYDTIPPGAATTVRTSPAPEVNGALGNADGQSDNVISKEVSAKEFAAATATPTGTYLLQSLSQEGLHSTLEASGGSLVNQMGGLTSSFGGGGSALSNNVNSATGSLGNVMTGALQGLGAR